MVTRYDLSLVNTESRFEVPKIVEALRRKGFGTLCFYGPPGTGKTALAEHLAAELRRPLMIRQASDLVSKFVGETEQNMAKMFAEAEAEQAVLLLDEADSFLRSRRLAERHYEVTRSLLEVFTEAEGLSLSITMAPNDAANSVERTSETV